MARPKAQLGNAAHSLTLRSARIFTEERKNGEKDRIDRATQSAAKAETIGFASLCVEGQNNARLQGRLQSRSYDRQAAEGRLAPPRSIRSDALHC